MAAAALAVALAAAGSGAGPAARAHEGPAFPVTLSAASGPYQIDLWADPDVGTGTFWLQLKGPGLVPADTRVTLTVAPEDGHRAAARHEATWSPTAGTPDEARWEAAVPLDAAGFWTVDVAIAGPAGAGAAQARVEALETGPSTGEGLVATLPFALLAVFGLGAWWRGRRGARGGGAGAEDRPGPRAA